MLKHTEIIIDNFYGIDVELQNEIFNMMLSVLDVKKEQEYIKSLTNILEYDIKANLKLKNIIQTGFNLNDYYTAKLLDDNKEFVYSYIYNKKYKNNEKYKEIFFHDCQIFDLHIINMSFAIFETQKADDKKVVEFIESFKTAYPYEQKNFINSFIRSNFYFARIPYEYYPGVNIIDKELDEVILYLFGDKIFKESTKMEPIRKAQLIQLVGKQIIDYYHQQLKFDKTTLTVRRSRTRKVQQQNRY